MAAGLEPGDTLPAPWWNYFIGRISAWTKYVRGFFNEADDEFAYPVTKTRTLFLSPAEMTAYSAAGIYGSSWTTAPISELTQTGAMISTSDAAVLFKDITSILPRGSILDTIEVLVDPGAARAVAGDRTKATIHKQTPDMVTPLALPAGTSLDATVSDSGSALQVITLDVSPETVAAGSMYFLSIFSGDDGGSHNADTIHAIRITVTEVSPSQWGA